MSRSGYLQVLYLRLTMFPRPDHFAERQSLKAKLQRRPIGQRVGELTESIFRQPLKPLEISAGLSSLSDEGSF